MKHIIIALACILSCVVLQAQPPNKEAFLLLNLDYPRPTSPLSLSPTFSYEKDINWQYWQMKDNELC